jgi:hypothetical protein
MRTWRRIQTGVLSGAVMAGRVASRVSLTLSALLALAVPAILEAQITASSRFDFSDIPDRVTFTGTYTVPPACRGLDTFTFLQGRDPSGRPIGTTSFVSATPAAPTAVTPGSNGGFLVEFKPGIPDQENVVANFNFPTGTTQAVFAVGITVGSSSACSNPSLSFSVPIVTAPPNLTITKTAVGPAGPISDGGTVYDGDYIRFDIVVTNSGGPTTGTIEIDDNVPSTFHVDSFTLSAQNGVVGPNNDVHFLITTPIQTGQEVHRSIVTRVGKSGFVGISSNTVTVMGGGAPTPKSATMTLSVLSGFIPFSCSPGGVNLCLGTGAGGGVAAGPAPLAVSATGRFQVRVYWNAVHQGTSGKGQAVALTSDTGYFWFFSANNVELVIKVVDGRPVNGKFWVFYGALTNVEYIIEVVDSVTGAVQGYFNPQDTQASNADTSAFGSATTVGTENAFQFIPMNTPVPASGHPMTPLSELGENAVSAACVADALTQCLNGGRFQVRVHWDALHQGTSGEGQAVPITSDTGYFWFFSANNIELVIKVVDGRPVNGKFWVFYGALTNVQYTITITDTVTGAVKKYFNPQDTQASASDTSAF